MINIVFAVAGGIVLAFLLIAGILALHDWVVNKW